MLPQTSQDDSNQFLEVSDKCGLPRSAYDIVWPKVGAQTHPKDITRIMERNMANIYQQCIDSHNIKNNWNRQLAPLCIYIDWFCRLTGGYCTDMVNHLGACIVMMLKHHKDLIDGACLAAFRRQLPEPFVWHTHKEDFKSYQRDSGVLKHIVYGMFGCWQPAFEHGLVCVLHIKVPQFDSSIKNEEAMRDVY